MPAGDLIQLDYQYEYNGLLIGDDTDYHVQELDGLSGFPAVRSNSADRFGRHGAVGSRHYLPARTFFVKFDMTPLTDDAFADQRDAIQFAFGPRTDPQDELPFVFMHPGRDKLQVFARPTAMDLPNDRLYALKFPQVTVRFEATNPLLTSPEAQFADIEGTSDATGLDFPLDFPLNFGAASTNSVSVTNAGTAPAQWVAVLTGPATDPHISEDVTGAHLHTAGLTLAAGETLVISSANRTVLLNGTASRRHLLDPHSRWFELLPNTPTGIRYSTSGAGETSTMRLEWNDTYWSD